MWLMLYAMIGGGVAAAYQSEDSTASGWLGATLHCMFWPALLAAQITRALRKFTEGA